MRATDVRIHECSFACRSDAGYAGTGQPSCRGTCAGGPSPRAAVAIAAGGGIASVTLAAEAATSERLRALREMSASEPVLVTDGASRRRARTDAHRSQGGHRSHRRWAERRSGAGAGRPALPRRGHTVRPVPDRQAMPHSCESAAVLLAKTARLLPAAVTATIRDLEADDLPKWASRHGLLWVDAGDINQYDFTAARNAQAGERGARAVRGRRKRAHHRLPSARRRPGASGHAARRSASRRPRC